MSKKRGNSALVRIQTAVMDVAMVPLDQRVDIREEAGRVIVEPTGEPACDLGDLLATVADENIHDEIDFGSAVGKELL